MWLHLSSPTALENIEEKWYKEINEYWNDPKHNNDTKKPVPFILVGTELDMRNDPNVVKKKESEGVKVVTREKGQAMADKLHARKYVECSARTQEGLKEVFDSAIRCAMQIKQEKKKDSGGGCCVIV